MNSGQKQFLDFFLDRVLADKKEQALELLTNSFKEQAEAPLTLESFVDLKEKLMPLIRPDKQAEVEQAMNHFGSQLQK